MVPITRAHALEQVEIDKVDNTVYGRTTFVVAHRLSTIIDADRIVVVKDGKNTENGSYEELMARQGVFYELAKGRIS